MDAMPNTPTTLPLRAERLAELQLSALYQASSILGNSLKYQQTISRALQVLHDEAHLHHAMLALLSQEKDQLIVDSVHAPHDAELDNSPERRNSPELDNSPERRISHAVRYRAGEGIIGSVVEHKQPVVLTKIADDLRFADKLALYDMEKPFIAVPVMQSSDQLIGVLAAQPATSNYELLSAFTRFLEMIASLVAKNVLLARGVAEQKTDLEDERDRLRRKVRENYSFDNMVGHTRPMRKVFEQIRLVSKWDSTVLVRGESGTGKELIANAIHYNSPRASGPFVKINCAALPEHLLESELFGHEKGAFTGAVKLRKGRFETADGGTLFLDEIGEISAAFQAKLLRVLQEGEFERVGGSQTLSVDVRIIAATNKNLEQEVREQHFREDLYYRLNVMPVYPPPLRDRIEDIPDLATFLIDKLSKRQQRKLTLTNAAVRRLMGYDWPGNVRELENMLERAAIMSEDGTIDQDLILLNAPGPFAVSSQPQSEQTDLQDPDLDERQRVIAALEQAGWVQAKAARLLNMTPRQIAYRIQTMNIRMRQL